MKTLVLKPTRTQRIRGGHPWVFAGEVQKISGEEQPGEVVQVKDAKGKFVGLGTVNPNSNILVRLLTRMEETIDDDFWRRRIEEALKVRGDYLTGTDAYRLIHSEADGLPGLVVDRYGPYLSVQILAMGIEVRRDLIIQTLIDLVKPRGIFERSDVSVRRLEGLEERKGPIWGQTPPKSLIINEGPYQIGVDIQNGQKTGFFLDQRPNRLRVGELAKGRRVLNAFSYSGGFTMAAALGGATEVVSVDISAEAIALGEANAQMNGVSERCSWVTANAFDFLREQEKAKELYDMIILDPPAFTKSKDSIPGAIRGYKEINLRAIRMLRPGGMLVSASCSHHMDAQTFVSVIQDAANDSGRRLRQLDLRGAGIDHPVLPAAPETNYLKCFYGTVN